MHKKAIDFEKMGWSTTHLVFSEENELILQGYFSFANRKLKLSNKNFEKLSKTQKKKLLKSATREDNYVEINSYLIGQLGKNYDVTGGMTGAELLTIAYNMLLEVVKIVKVKYVWLECDHEEKLINFYQDFGFNLIKDYYGENKLNVLIMKLESD